ncbi:hypothetical protein K440DRAFT_661502 [Wilcoxina mikolae CBS 423.85]|nr:hypothetical protein K440DRAFT_661502 [Wilcoxina mikolae CBS 423.85]
MSTSPSSVEYQPLQESTQATKSCSLCGAGCFSESIRQEMRITNPDGVLGNVTMSQIDALTAQQLHDLDIGLVSFVHEGYPYRKTANIAAPQEIDLIQGAFLAAGITVRARDIGRDTDYNVINLPQRIRLARSICHQYQDGRQPGDYSLVRHKNAQMFETLVETCRYRGLFNAEGNCISKQDVYMRKLV